MLPNSYDLSNYYFYSLNLTLYIYITNYIHYLLYLNHNLTKKMFRKYRLLLKSGQTKY